MTHRKVRSLLCSAAVAACCAAPVSALDKRALVIADDLDRRADALAVSEALLGLGFDVQRLETPDAAALTAAMDSLRDADGVTAVYYAGSHADPADLADPTSDTARFVFVDACVASNWAAVPENTYAVAPDTACSTGLTADVLRMIRVPGLTTDQWDVAADYRVMSRLQEPYVFRQPSSDLRLTADDYAMLDTLSPAARNKMIALWRSAGIPVDVADAPVAAATILPVAAAPQTVVVSPVVPVAPAATVVTAVTPRVGTVVTGGVTRIDDPVSVVAGQPSVPAPAAPTGGGSLPTPSILVGFAVDVLPDAPAIPSEPVAGNTFGYEDTATREALRTEDADLFSGLVAAGAFDPPPDDLPRALQAELARINCYTSGIDGAWGSGSRQALAAYYAQLGQTPPGEDADIATFRDVIARDDVRCPDPVVPVAAPQPVAQTAAPQQAVQQPVAQSSRVVTPVAPAPVAATPAPPAAPQAPAAQSPRRTINQTGGTGVFR